MPHKGKPSAACKTCKQRHIRCDETRPSCNRCLKTNRLCPGYAEGLDLVLRDQNDVAKANVGRREKAAQRARLTSQYLEGDARSTLTYADDLSLSLSSSYSSKKANELVFSPSYLAPSEDDYQLCLFMGAWVLFPHDEQGDRGYIELLPSMYSFAKLDSPLALCVAAISGALSAKFVRKMKDVELPEVRRKYTKALAATRTALQDPVESLTDETLMAICLLGFYEGVVTSFRGRISSPRHFDGAAALINQRQGRLSTAMAQRLLLGVRNSILQRAVAHTTPIDTSSALWQNFDSIPHNAATLLDQMSIEIPNLLVAAARFRQENQGQENANSLPDKPTQERNTIITQALALDATLSTWPSSTPPSFNPTHLPASQIPPRITSLGAVYQTHCSIYPDIVACETHNSYRVSRIKLLSAIASLSPPSSPHLAPSIAKLQSLADAICASVPYCLGDRTGPIPLYSTEATYPTIDGRPPSAEQHRAAVALGGWFLLGPLKEVMRVGRWLRPGQLAWVGGQLGRLARCYDVKPEDD